MVKLHLCTSHSVAEFQYLYAHIAISHCLNLFCVQFVFVSRTENGNDNDIHANALCSINSLVYARTHQYRSVLMLIVYAFYCTCSSPFHRPNHTPKIFNFRYKIFLSQTICFSHSMQSLNNKIL